MMFIIIMVVFFLLPQGSNEPMASEDRLVLQKFKKSLLQSRKEVFNSHYWSGYGNLTGLKLSYQDSIDNKNVLHWPFREYSPSNPWRETETDSILPNQVRDRVGEFWDGETVVSSDEECFPLNISGQIFGEFDVVRPERNIRPIKMDLPQYLFDYYLVYREDKFNEEEERYLQDPENNPPPKQIPDTISKVGNITEFSQGRIGIEIQDFGYNFLHPELKRFVKENPHTKVDDAVVVTVSMFLKDYPEIHHDELKMIGIYFQNLGSLVATTKSAKFQGGHALPHFTMNERNFNKSKILMSQFVNVTDIENEVTLDDMNNGVDRALGMCEYVSYFQLEKTAYTQDQLRLIDEELANPQGIPIPKVIPPLQISDALLYSPDCGIVLQSKKSKDFLGVRQEVSTARSRVMAIGVLLLAALELHLLARQMKNCRSPGQLSNVSSATVFLLQFWQLITIIYFILKSWEDKNLYLILTCVSLLALMLCLNQLRFLVSVLTAQTNERGTTWWEILRGSTRNADTQEAETNDDSTQVPQTQAQPVQDAPTNGDNIPPQMADEARYPNMIAFLGFTLTCAALILISSITTWRITYRRVAEYCGFICVTSMWVPQFFRNTLKNRVRALLWEYTIGTSLLRFIPIIYLCLDKKNALRHHKDPMLVFTILSWLLFQLFFLYLQDRLGARFWVKDNWLPDQYNYHPVIRVKDLESGFSSDILANMKSQTAKDEIAVCEVDCAICMASLQVPVLTDDKEGNHKKAYEALIKEIMVTPCHHVFHTKCLEDWMIYKLQCPVCRCGLPPV